MGIMNFLLISVFCVEIMILRKSGDRKNTNNSLGISLVLRCDLRENHEHHKDH